MSSSASNGNNDTSSGSSSGEPVASVLDPTIIGVVVGVVVLIVMIVVVLRFRHSNNNKVVAALEEFNHDYEELKEKLELTCRALSLSFSTVDDGWDLRSASRPNSVSSQRSSASTINPHQSSASVNWFLGMLRLLQKASCHYCVCQCVDESQVWRAESRS